MKRKAESGKLKSSTPDPRPRTPDPIRHTLSDSERRTLLAILRKHQRTQSISARYEGAMHTSRRSRLPNAIQFPRLDSNKATRLELARRADYWEKNEPITNRICDLWENYTVGWNLQIVPNTSDAKFNEEAKAAFDEWAEAPEVGSRQDLIGVLGVASRGWAVRGDHFIQLTKKKGRPAIQGIEGTQVQTPAEFSKAEGNSIIDGVVVDADGMPTAYWAGYDDGKGRLAFDKAVPANQMVHIAEMARAGQYRGLTVFHPVMNEIHDLADLHDMEMMAARDAAERSLFITNEIAEADDETLLRGAGQVANQTASGTNFFENRIQYFRECLGGRIAYGITGEKVEQIEGQRPSVTTRDYWRYKTELVCIGVGIPYVLVFPDSMQGTVYRGALDMANAFFRARFKVIECAARQIYRFFLQQTFARRPADWKSVSIQPPRAVNVDVGRNSAADMAELESCATNWDLIFGPRGLDWRKEFQKMSEQMNYARSLGLPIDAMFAKSGLGSGVSDLGSSAPDRGAQTTDPSDDDLPVPNRTNGEPHPA